VANIIPLIVIYGLILHTAMFAFDIVNPDPFLNADRAWERLANAEGLSTTISHSSHIGEYLATHGVIGDYLIHAVIYIPLRQYGVIAFQIAMLLLSVAALFKLTELVSDSKITAAIAALVYMHLPHSLVFPHQLSSEAISSPLIIISFYLLAQYLLKKPSAHFLILSGASFGIAILVRPVLALWPIAVMFLLLFVSHEKSALLRAPGYAIAALAPLLLWMLFILIATGKFSMGSSEHDLNHNLYNRTEIMIDSLPSKEKQAAKRQFLTRAANSEQELSLSTYLRFAAAKPGAFGAHLLGDAIVFVSKSGVNRLVLDYFNAFPEARHQLQQPPTQRSTGWRRYLDQHGLAATVVYLISRHPLLIIINVSAAILCLALMSMSLFGGALLASQLPRVDSGGKLIRLLILAFPFYVFSASQVVSAMQSRHRAPAEFALCLLFAVAARYLVTLRYQERLANA
jgi:4-amino-4-deoxy-L-arabinose transferase-like glycosyltransferase